MAKRHGWPLVVMLLIWSTWATYTAFPTAEEKKEHLKRSHDAISAACDGSVAPPDLPQNGVDVPALKGKNLLTADDLERGFVLTSIGTDEVHDFIPSENAVIDSDWRTFGATRDWTYLAFDDWAFLLGTNEVKRLRICSHGEVDPVSPGVNACFAPFKSCLGIVPAANWHLLGEADRPSQFWHEMTSLNSLKLTWQNVLYNRAAGTPVSFQMEIWPNGNFAYRYGLAKAGLWNGEAASNIFVGAVCERLMKSVDIFSLTNLTSLAFYRLDPDDMPGSDRDEDGLSIEDELFVYHTDPNCWDSDLDGISDGAEVALGTDPTSRDSDGDGLVDGSDPDPAAETPLTDLDGDSIPDAYEEHWFGGTNFLNSALDRDETGFNLIGKLLCGINPTNAPFEAVVASTNALISWKLFNAFAADWPTGATNVVWERTFPVNRTSAWQQLFLSSSATNAAPWNLRGMNLEWETNEGASGLTKASPFNDSYRIPLSSNDFPSSITLRLRSTGAHAVYAPTPVHLIVYVPQFVIEGGERITGKSGLTFSVFKDGSDSAISLKVDHSLRPCKAAIGDDECDMTQLLEMSEYNGDFSFTGDSTGGTITARRPGAYEFPSFAIGFNPPSTFRKSRSGGGPGKVLVVLDPSARWACDGHGCGYDGLGYDWWSDSYYGEEYYPLDSKCLRKSWYRDWIGRYYDGNCEVVVTAGTDSSYVTTDVVGNAGHVYVDGVEVWSDSPEHTYDDADCGGGGYFAGYLGDSCDSCESGCKSGNCDSHEGPSLGSLKFRIPLGNPAKGHLAGFAWFSAHSPISISRSSFSVLAHPSASVSDTTSAGVRRIVCTDRRGRDLRLQDISHGVCVTIYETGTGKLEHAWEITNIDGDHGRIRLRKISRQNNVMTDETYSYSDGDWVRFDNIAGIETELYVEDGFSEYGDGARRETRITKDAAGNVLETVTTEDARIGECDNAVMREVYREETTGRNTIYTYAEYWNDPAHSSRHGQPRLVWGNARAWAYTDFDEKGHETLRVEQRGGAICPDDLPYVVSNVLHNATSIENAFVTVKDYAPLDGDSCHADDAAKARLETRYLAVNGNVRVIGRTWKRYTRLDRNGYSAIKEETWRALSPSATRDAASNAYSYEISFASTGEATPLLMRGAVAESLDENGVLTVNTYSPDVGILTQVSRKSFNGVPCQTYFVTEKDATYGNVLRQAEYLTATDVLIGNEVSTFDEKDRLRSTTYLDGTYITNAYSCCRLLWRQDREGRKALRSAKTGTDHLYSAEEDVWLAGISTNGQYRVTQHFLDALGRETNTVVYAGAAPGEAVEASASDGKVYSSAKTTYPYGGSDYAVSTDERGKVTVSRTDILWDAMESGEAVLTNGVEVMQTESRTYFGGGTSFRREWGGGKWTTERRFTDYAEDGKRLEYVVTESSDCGTVTNSVTVYDLLGRVELVSVPGANSSRIVTQTSYDRATNRKVLEVTTGSQPLQYRYNILGELWEKRQRASLVRNELSYETISGEVFRVAINLRMTGSVTNTIQVRKQQLTGLSNGLCRRVISASADRTTTEECSYNPEKGLRTVTYKTENMSPTVYVARYGLAIAQTSLDQKVEMSYDALGRQIVIRSFDISSGSLTKQECTNYDISGNVIATKLDLLDGRIALTIREYDALNQEVRKANACGSETIISYDPVGRIIAYNGDTYPLKSDYDNKDHKICGLTTRDDGSTWDETKWEFDATSGLNTAKVYDDGSRISYDYTNNGKKTRTTWARGAWRHDAYNEQNLVSATTYSDNTPLITYDYNDAGKIASANLVNGYAALYQYDDRLLNVRECVSHNGNTYALVRTYDSFRRNEKTFVVFTNVYNSAKTRIYDGENRICGYALTNSLGRGATVNVSYNGFYKNAIEYMLPNGNTFRVEFERESARKELVTNCRYLYGPQQMYAYSTEYDLIGRPVNASDSFSCHREWLYNRCNELSSALIGTNVYFYAYDSIGNRQWSVANSTTNSYQANALNQYRQLNSLNLIYDADGNLLQGGEHTYVYDAENRLTSVWPIYLTSGTLAVMNEYDHKGRRIRKMVKRFENGSWENYAVHDFVWDGNNLILERITFVNDEVITKEYFWGLDESGTEQDAGGVGGLLAVSINGVFSIPCYDHNGNIVAYVSEDGGIEALYIYDAYGNVIDQSGENVNKHSFGFSSKYHDREVGLIAYQKRFYRPDYGRWLNRDPIEEVGGENLYAFCQNNPISYYDINGFSTCCRNGKKISCDSSYNWNGVVTTASVTLIMGATFVMIDLTSNYVCSSCTRYRLHAKAVLPTISYGAPISMTGSNVKFNNVPPEAFAGTVTLGAGGIGAMGVAEVSYLRIGQATSFSAGFVGGAELGIGVAYGWIVDFEMVEE